MARRGCYKHEQMAEKPDGKREGERTVSRLIENQAEKGLKFTLGNAVSRTGKTYSPKKRPKITLNKPLKAGSHIRSSLKTEPAF